MAHLKYMLCSYNATNSEVFSGMLERNSSHDTEGNNRTAF